ncbi:hypothetical protein [Nitratireductor thuwali]|uniref:Uncharacterized protein n=1 Tax=Nitratireductor thuwali TaxID=2267699 RepID=A0ABY5MPW2_9HYPH|nr:hypothetical protein NTH_04005 [Nitratireductor thuwali]
MAPVFPRDVPDYQTVELTFTLTDSVTSAASHKGAKINMSKVADDVWELAMETNVLEPDRKRIWSAWKKSFRGLREFLAYDTSRNPPAAYPDATAPGDISDGWNGTAGVASVGASGLLGLSGLPAGYQAKVGDRVGLEQSGHYGYYEVLEDVAADGFGAVTLAVAPFLHTSIFTTAATARLWLPVCKFIMDPRSWSESNVLVPTPVSFKAVQRVMA